MQLFELVSPRLFRPLAGPNRAFYAELLLLLWEECRHTADYSILRAEAVSRAEDYFAALAKPLALDADDAGDEAEQPTRDPHTLALGFLLRLRRTGWLAEQPGSYEEEPALAFVPEVTPLLEALEEILNPRVVTYTGKLYKAWQLLQNVGEEKSPYENVLREVAGDLEALNKSLRALNASIGHYIDQRQPVQLPRLPRGRAGRLRDELPAPAGAGLRPGGALRPERGRSRRPRPHPETAGRPRRDEHPHPGN